MTVFAAVALWLRGYWKPHWGGVALGTAVTFAALVPYALEAMAPGAHDDRCLLGAARAPGPCGRAG